MKKNVLIVAYDGLKKSGVPGVIMEIISGLCDEYNFSLAVFENINLDYYFGKIKELNVNVILVPPKKRKSKLIKLYNEFIGFHIYTFKFFNSLFQTHHFDIVHSFKEGDSSGVFRAAKLQGIKTRIWHTTVLHENNNGLLGLLSKHKLKLSLKYASLFVGGSDLSCKLAFKKRKYVVITNCYKSDTYVYIDSGPFENLEMVQVGYFSTNKNQLFTIDVCKNLLRTFPTFKMHFIGFPNEEKYYELLKKQIDGNNLQKNVFIHNFDENQMDIFKRCSYSLMPSKREGFSLTLVEAQASGLKCIASTSIPNDANAGGVIFLDLVPKLWSDYIIEDYKKCRGKHILYPMTKFSRTTFLQKIKKLYD